MKTAIVQTTFWQEESFADLHIDTKIVYFYLLTNPERGLSNIMKLNRRVVSAHTGLNVEQINICLDQLDSLGYIARCESYISLIRDHVQAKSGRFTESAIRRELSTVPQSVRDALSQFVSGTVPEHKDKDNIRELRPPVDNSYRFNDAGDVIL